MMRLKHRCNSLGEILEAQQLGYGGVEFDLVWESGDLVLSHDLGGSGPLFYWILDRIPEDFVMAINVKEYGMCARLTELLVGKYSDYFVFDVPGPELEEYAKSGLRFYGRCSEYEWQLSHHGKIVDSFKSDPQFVLGELLPGDALISPTLRGLPEWSGDVLKKATFLVTK